MNTIIALLYLASIVNGLSLTLIILGSIAFILFTIVLVVWSSSTAIETHGGNESPPVAKEVKFGFKAAVFALIMGLLIPSDTTVYTVIGLKTASIAAETDLGQDLIDNVKDLIELQIKNLKEEMTTGEEL